MHMGRRLYAFGGIATGGIVVDDERGWHIALWNRVWVDLIFCTNVENGVLLVRKPLAT